MDGKGRAYHEQLLTRLDLLLAGEEDQDVPKGLGDVDLQHRDHASVQVVRLGCLSEKTASSSSPPRGAVPRQNASTAIEDLSTEVDTRIKKSLLHLPCRRVSLHVSLEARQLRGNGLVRFTCTSLPQCRMCNAVKKSARHCTSGMCFRINCTCKSNMAVCTKCSWC